mgnify:CR=1 FL=1
MRMRQDQRGFVLSGTALLLVLPAMLLVASCFAIIEMGGEAAALQASADKVFYTGNDIERVVKDLWGESLLIDNADITLSKLADNYRAATGLLVDIGPATYGENTEIPVYVRDPRGVVRYFTIVELR